MLQGLQEVTRGYKVSQGLTGFYKGLIEVTGGYERLHGDSKSYRG